MPSNYFQQFQSSPVSKQSPYPQRSKAINKGKTSKPDLKIQLISQLQSLLLTLSDLSNISNFSYDQKSTQHTDPTIIHLQIILNKSKQHKLKEIQKLCMLAIGKRILNVQIYRKKIQCQKKRERKAEIDDIFRENRIKKYDYNALIQQKLKKSTLIARPYSSGKGFIGTHADYQNMQDVLQECKFLQVIREVNSMFFSIFSGCKQDKTGNFNMLLFKITLATILIFLFQITFLPISSVYTLPTQKTLLSIILCIIMFLLAYIAISTYLNLPNDNNQMQQSIYDTKQYLKGLNQKNVKEGKKFQWSCSDDFMYLQVKFRRSLRVG